MDRSSILGIFLGVGAIISGNIFEGGEVGSILQVTAAVIVFGGTLGATLVSYPLSDIGMAVSALKDVFWETKVDHEADIKEIIRYSNIARRKGIVALETEIPKIKDHFFKKALGLAVDGIGLKTLKETMEQENITYEEKKRRIARVYETAGGFAPTIGIIGAVLGLIHVMENLSDPSKLGTGIAVAFVATVYGVGSANLILLPISKKLIHRLKSELYRREMILEGVIGILSGINPHHLRERLNVYLEVRK